MKRIVVSAVLVGLSFGPAAACGAFSGADAPAGAADAEADRSPVPPEDSGGSDGGKGEEDAEDPRPRAAGCADGTREGFVASEAGIAACEGAWTVPGVFAEAGPQCARLAGNDGNRKNGFSCGAADLCALQWHVCRDAADVLAHGGGAPGELCQSSVTDGGTFYATAQPSDGLARCDMSAGFDDIFGCGDTSVPGIDCGPLNAVASSTQPVPGFSLNPDGGERRNVVKMAGPGGVLCCRN